MECCYATQLPLFLTTSLQSHSTQFPFQGLHFRELRFNPDRGFNFHKIRYPLVSRTYHFYGCHTRQCVLRYETKGFRGRAREAREPQPDCKAIVPFRKSNPFLAVTIDDDHSFWLNRSECFGGSVLIWDLHLCIRKQLSFNVASNYLISESVKILFFNFLVFIHKHVTIIYSYYFIRIKFSYCDRK